ncbi:N-acetylneuraminate synthase family protein [Rufibacter quisquiliarum]|uniref:Sialic acid synthase SpsE n=1 Tax=Rufibacter quisquiliarum TaxID=1549639 RepID=A0A839GQ02_9BACT|nr:N-acetylneuraminate synthase family protein [Rufibacter quisquiliarum]MBA9076977.1 sialic acid synthase SpsE [Rufibacter quisquiliarum]
MRPIIIAECCQNHNGDKEILKGMIHAAAENGADYVKIQSIRSSDLTYRERFEEGETAADGTVKTIKRPYQPELERLAKLDLSLEQEAWFVEECWRAGVAPMTTAFTRSVVKDIKDLGYEAIKVASYDCASYPLLEDLKKDFSTIFVSTGATYDDEIAKAAEILRGTNFHLLHCVTIYPTPLEEVHIRRMSFLRKFTHQVGYSDHSKPSTTGLWASKIALALGASCIERHYTVLPADQTRDGVVSITPDMVRELREFADLSRYEQMEIIKRELPEWEQTLGQATRPLSHAEMLNRDYYRGRFASKVDGQPVYNWEE